jgi:hypothetical protein
VVADVRGRGRRGARARARGRRRLRAVDRRAHRIDGTAEGVVFSYYGHYWAGDAGDVQLVTFTAKTLFDEYATDFADLLDGLVITKP